MNIIIIYCIYAVETNENERGREGERERGRKRERERDQNTQDYLELCLKKERSKSFSTAFFSYMHY